MNQLLRLIETLPLLELEKIRFEVEGRKIYLEVCLKKKRKKERLFIVEKINDVWVIAKVCLSTILRESCMQYCVNEMCRNCFGKKVKTFMGSSGKSFKK